MVLFFSLYYTYNPTMKNTIQPIKTYGNKSKN